MWNGSADKTELQVDFARFGRGFWGHDLQTMDIFISTLYVNLLEGLVVRNLHQSFCSHLADMPLSAELRHTMLALVKLQGSPPSAKWDPRVDTKFLKLRARFFPQFLDESTKSEPLHFCAGIWGRKDYTQHCTKQGPTSNHRKWLDNWKSAVQVLKFASNMQLPLYTQTNWDNVSVRCAWVWHGVNIIGATWWLVANQRTICRPSSSCCSFTVYKCNGYFSSKMQRHTCIHKMFTITGSKGQLVRQSHEKLTSGKQWQSATHQKPADDKKTDWKWNRFNSIQYNKT